MSTAYERPDPTTGIDLVVWAIYDSFSRANQLEVFGQSAPFTAVLRDLNESVSFVVRVDNGLLALARIDHAAVVELSDLTWRNGQWQERGIIIQPGDADWSPDEIIARDKEVLLHDELPVEGTWTVMGSVADDHLPHHVPVMVDLGGGSDTTDVAGVSFRLIPVGAAHWLRQLHYPVQPGETVVLCQHSSGELLLLGPVVGISPLG